MERINDIVMRPINKKKKKGKSPKACHLCFKLFKNNQRLEKHFTKIHLFPSKMNFNCDQCSKSYGKVSLLKRHKRLIHGERSVQYKFKTCFTELLSFKLLRVHIKSAHSKKVQCDKCSKVFLKQSRLKRHLKVCKGKAEDATKSCHKCSKIFKYPSQLKEHLVTHEKDSSKTYFLLQMLKNLQ